MDFMTAFVKARELLPEGFHLECGAVYLSDEYGTRTRVHVKLWSHKYAEGLELSSFQAIVEGMPGWVQSLRERDAEPAYQQGLLSDLNDATDMLPLAPLDIPPQKEGKNAADGA